MSAQSQPESKIFQDGSVYLGEVIHKSDQVIANGKGSCFFKNKNNYSGDWVNDKFEGNGKYEWVSGNTYEGAFKDGKRNGVGIYSKSGLKYQQVYKEGKLVSQQRYIPSVYAKVQQYVSAVGGVDKVLRTICYVAKLLVWYFNKTGRTDATKRLATFVAPLSETRVIFRFFGLIPIIPGLWYRDSDPFLNIMYLLETFSMLFYYPFEHFGWLSGRKILFEQYLNSGKLLKWSCWCWFLYIILDMIVDSNNLLKLKFKRQNLYKDVVDSQADKLPEEHLADIKRQTNYTYLKFLQNLGDGVMAYNWSFESGPFPDVTIGVAGTTSSVVGSYLRWKNT